MFFFCLCAFLLVAPLYKAGNRPLPLLLLELAAIGILLVVAVQRAPLALPRSLAAAIGILLVYPVVQLVPVPEALWRSLPGRAEYAAVLERFAATGGGGGWRAISVVPSATEYGWLAQLPPLAALLGTLRLPVTLATRLLVLLTIFAGAESLLGLLQVGPGGGGALYLGNQEPGQRAAIGTFVNRNHFAAMLAMTLPVIVGLLVHSVQPGRRHGSGPGAALASEATAQRVLLFACGVLILVCLLFTRSRAGIASALVGLVGSGIVLVRARAASADAMHTRLAQRIVAALVALSIALALAIGVGPLVRGLEAGPLQGSADFRAAIYVATLRAAVEFLPLGSGLSTFAHVFPRFQTGELAGYIDFAHNDYLQAFLELGLAAPVVVALLLVAYVSRMTALLRLPGGRSFTLLQLAAGAGLLPMILHGLFDFALHIPANAMWYAALAGVLFHRGPGARRPAGDAVAAPGDGDGTAMPARQPGRSPATGGER